MKCYRHPDVDAVGVCSACGKGVCSSCAVTVAGKIYCKPDTDRIFGNKAGREGAQAKGRSVIASVASVVFVLFGGGELGLSFLLIYAGMVVGSFKDVSDILPSVYSVNLIDSNVSLLPIILGMALLFIAVMGIGAGAELWRERRTGAVLGFVQVIAAIVLVVLFLSPGAAPSYTGVFYSVIGLNLLLGCLIIIGWSSLK